MKENMPTQNDIGRKKIRRAILSVSDKTGLVEFARTLRGFGAELLSTGGTARALRDAGLEARDVSDVTGFPEMLDGRVKTLHPRIHGGLLAVRDDKEHTASLEEHGIEPIDMAVINLYPFERTVAREGVTREEAVEQIDIGGPSMVRSAAKNFKDVAIVVSPEDYDLLSEELSRNDGSLSLTTRERLALKAFRRTASYDLSISEYLQRQLEGEPDALPDSFTLKLQKTAGLRYGENPHQRAALYEVEERSGVAHAETLGGKEMSYNNYVDADAAYQLVCDFDEAACAIIKHTNPSGVGTAATLEEAYRLALETDPVSAFGGVVAFNRRVDASAARALTEIFTEVVVAPDYDEDAIEALKTKKNLRILRAGEAAPPSGVDIKRISGGLLIQTRDSHRLTSDDLKLVTRRAPTDEETKALLFAWTVCKHTKSNAIVYAREGQTVGVGAGQMSRVDSARIGAMRARLPLEGSVVASDAFFPFRDGIDEIARHGVSAIIQPGGSVKDSEVVAAANEHGVAMVFTGVRHFRH